MRFEDDFVLLFETFFDDFFLSFFFCFFFATENSQKTFFISLSLILLFSFSKVIKTQILFIRRSMIYFFVLESIREH